VHRVLFVCTGNIFRSLTAEFALRRALGPGSSIVVSSAGTEDLPHIVRPVVRDYLLTCGYDVSAHRRRTLTRELIESATLIVAMNHDHQRFIREYHSRDVPLYTEACGQSAESLPDVDDVIPDPERNPQAVEAHVRATIDKIIALAPGLARTLAQS
jgi:protein-tyrosine phosphatase